MGCRGRGVRVGRDGIHRSKIPQVSYNFHNFLYFAFISLSSVCRFPTRHYVPCIG